MILFFERAFRISFFFFLISGLSNECPLKIKNWKLFCTMEFYISCDGNLSVGKRQFISIEIYQTENGKQNHLCASKSWGKEGSLMIATIAYGWHMAMLNSWGDCRYFDMIWPGGCGMIKVCVYIYIYNCCSSKPTWLEA